MVIRTAQSVYEKMYVLCGFLFGLSSLLFVSLPFGRVSMFDFACYFLAPLIFIFDNRFYSKAFRWLLGLSLCWLITGVLSDWYRHTPFLIAFKANMIIFDTTCMLIVAFWLAKRSPFTVVAFLIGNAISSVISLYIFQNGAFLYFAERAGYGGSGTIATYLIEKQVYPLYCSFGVCAVLWSFTCIGKLRIPYFVLGMGVLTCGGILLVFGESRSSFLTFALTSLFAFAIAFSPRLIHSFIKHKFLAFTVGILTVAIIGWVYYYLAANNYLSETAYLKYLARKNGEISMLDDRSDILINWPFLWRSPILGAGSEGLDPWGYILKSGFVDVTMLDPDAPLQLYTHSCLVGAWSKSGIGGLVFWLYAFYLLYKCLCEDLLSLGRHAIFFFFCIMSTLWAILFSPYGGFRGKCCVMLAFAALITDKRYSLWVASKLAPERSQRRIRQNAPIEIM